MDLTVNEIKAMKICLNYKNREDQIYDNPATLVLSISPKNLAGICTRSAACLLARTKAWPG